MAQATEIEYDPFAFEVQKNPFEIYRTLRDEHPVYYNARRDFWALSRFADVQQAARNWQTFSNLPGVELDEMVDLIGEGDVLNMDPPRHDQIRHILRDSFIPKAIARLEPQVRARVQSLLGQCLESGEADLAHDLAWPLPIGMVCDLLGVPPQDGPQVLEWVQTLEVRDPGSSKMPKLVSDAVSTIKDYLTGLVHVRQKQPRDDVLSVIAKAHAAGELEEGEIAGLAFILILAGSDTTASLLSNSLLVLEHHPDQLERLQRREVDLPQAIEELLRFESPVQNLARTATSSVALHGETIPEGARVLLIYGSANRDERRFEDPDRLDLGREKKRHLAFGEGIHHCLGAPLARLEARVAFEEFFNLVASYESAGPLERIQSHATRGLVRYPVKLQAA
jgi:cytochrome P450